MGEYQLLSLRFEWDDEKSRANEQKHGVTFVEAAGVLLDSFAVMVADSAHSTSEDRQTVIGQSILGRILHVTLTPRGTTGGQILRIISARKATAHEQRTRKANVPRPEKHRAGLDEGKSKRRRGRKGGGARR